MAQLGNIDTQRYDLFSAMYGGYTGNSGLPQPVVLTSTFWDDEKIATTVTHGYIRRQIPDSSLRKRLDDQLKFGEGLTECTYGEWIVKKTKKLFLLLGEIGCPEKIFDLIDGSWDDDDLPLSQESLAQLTLGPGMEKKFSKKQQLFMVRDLEPGTHVDYSEDEIVPLEVIFNRIPAARSQSAIEKVYLPRRRDIYYSRRRVPIAEEASSTHISIEAFMDEIRAMSSITHPHIGAIYATYTQHDLGYIILSPTVDQSLKAFIQYPPSTYKSLSKDRRKLLLIDWMHCLSEALAYLHEEGLAHGDIKPSGIIVDGSNKIYLADIGNSKSFDPKASQAVTDVERYEYGAPELWKRKMSCHETTQSQGVTISGRNRVRYRPTDRRPSDSSQESPPSSPVFEKSVHVGTWRSPTKVDYWNSDVFSLACIHVEILTFYIKRKSSAFASHRSCKNRRPRESAPPDASFHANMGQVDSWLDSIEKRAKDKHDNVLLGCLNVCRDMLQRDPVLRPTARRIEKELYKLVLGITDEELPHCGMHTVVVEGEENFPGWTEEYFGQSSPVSEDALGLSFAEVKPGSLEEKLRKLSYSSGLKSKRSTGSGSRRFSITSSSH
ncbi:kinase-like domain-containing protein [Tricharina praecox]|uniref:kinase-like domain-containing protein n=1 Tax=Tricharina praecox TaxID=43433 RepID=UPI00221E6B2D|nr:kinase-like domain-containing protein [Tricharina praecox]KAI5859026.1 kinase-like domain-containing protein [Tricharina praecox]